jgi:hypothetical protein
LIIPSPTILFSKKEFKAQRLAAQPLGLFRYVVTILAGILKPYFGVHSLNLGQVGCSRGLGRNYFFTLIPHLFPISSHTVFDVFLKIKGKQYRESLTLAISKLQS